MILIILIILIIISLSKDTFMKINKDLYETAYDLGVNFLEIVKTMNIINPTVMFDIDDTLLYVSGDSLVPIKPIIKLLNYCLRNKFIVLIITARDSLYTEHTKKDLSKNNINYDYLYLRVSPQDDCPTFKSDIKKMYLDWYGLKTVMSVGDNDIDINGQYSGYCIKLPNKTDPRLFHINVHGQLENVIP